ncbi:MAG: hypothetical protein AAB973_00835 [Patescibacteria group bacterium]
MKPKRARSSYILLLGMMSLLVVGAWLVYQVYAALTASQITERQGESIVPLDGTITQDALENLAGRRKFREADFSRLVFNISVATPSADNL